MITDRERFCAVLMNGPLQPCDTIVVPSGDGTVRCDVAIGGLKQRIGQTVLVSGGVDNPPHSLTADAMADYLIGRGLQEQRIERHPEPQNTREQAVQFAEWAKGELVEREWMRVALAVSPYHTFRLFLTFLKALEEADIDDRVHMIVLPASQTSWWRSPDGLDVSRLDLLADEFEKIDRYGEHVASFADGLDYLRFWEGPTE